MGNPSPVKKLNDVHVQIMDYMMAHAGCTLEQISAACGGYSIGWLSQIINSDIFQAQLKERQQECWGDVRATIKDRVENLAHVSLKRLEERVPIETDLDTVRNVADLALKSLGFGQPKAPAHGPQVNNNTLIVGAVDKESLEAARQLMHRPQQQLPERVLNPLPESAPVDQK